MQGQSRTCNVKTVLQSGGEAGLKNRKRLVHVAASSGPVPVWRARACVRMYVCIEQPTPSSASSHSPSLTPPRIYPGAADVCARVARRVAAGFSCRKRHDRKRRKGNRVKRRLCVRFWRVFVCAPPPLQLPRSLHLVTQSLSRPSALINEEAGRPRVTWEGIACGEMRSMCLAMCF